jgi:hypothetical protein
MSECEMPVPESRNLGDFARILSPATMPAPRVALGQENIANGLGKLVLTLVELIRELLERQALRRIEAGSLTEAEAEKLGVAFLKLSQEVQRLKKEFGLEKEDLNIDLGPLGKLL